MSANVGARWAVRNIFSDTQSLKPSPAFKSGFCSAGIANAPNARTGVSFNNSRRLMRLNCLSPIREFMTAPLDSSADMGFASHRKVAG